MGILNHDLLLNVNILKTNTKVLVGKYHPVSALQQQRAVVGGVGAGRRHDSYSWGKGSGVFLGRGRLPGEVR